VNLIKVVDLQLLALLNHYTIFLIVHYSFLKYILLEILLFKQGVTAISVYFTNTRWYNYYDVSNKFTLPCREC
jgi:hypothetical protein